MLASRPSRTQPLLLLAPGTLPTRPATGSTTRSSWAAHSCTRAVLPAEGVLSRAVPRGGFAPIFAAFSFYHVWRRVPEPLAPRVGRARHAADDAPMSYDGPRSHPRVFLSTTHLKRKLGGCAHQAPSCAQTDARACPCVGMCVCTRACMRVLCVALHSMPSHRHQANACVRVAVCRRGGGGGGGGGGGVCVCGGGHQPTHHAHTRACMRAHTHN